MSGVMGAEVMYGRVLRPVDGGPGTWVQGHGFWCATSLLVYCTLCVRADNGVPVRASLATCTRTAWCTVLNFPIAAFWCTVYGVICSQRSGLVANHHQSPCHHNLKSSIINDIIVT
jgi:hypothetical protein